MITMKREIRNLAITIFLLITLSLNGFAAEPNDGFLEYQVDGIKVIQIQDSFENFAVMNLYYEISKDQQKYPGGVDYLLMRTLLKGDTQKYTNTEIGDLKNRHIIQFNNLANYTYGALCIKFYKEDLQLVGQLLKEIIFANKLTESEFLEEQKQVYTKLSSIGEEEKILHRIRQNYYRSHPLSSPAAGTPVSIMQIDFPTLQEYYQQLILTGKLTIVIFGNFEKSEVEAALAGIKVDQRDKFEKLQIAIPTIDQSVEFIDSDQSFVAAYSNYQAKSTVELVGLHIIQEYLARRLYEVLRRELGLAYTVNVQIEVGELNTLEIKVVSDQGYLVGKTILQEMIDLLNSDIYDHDFEQVVRRFLTNFYLSLEDKERYADYVGEGLLLGFSPEGLLTFLDGPEMQEVGLYQRIARKLLANLVITYVGSYSDKEKIEIQTMSKEFEK